MSGGAQPNEGRWQNYVLHLDTELKEHWGERFAAGAKVCFIMGIGFDPRMCLGLECLREVAAPEALQVKAIEFGGSADQVAEESAKRTRTRFEELITELDTEIVSVAGEGDVDRFARNAAGLFETLEQLTVTDIVVDVDALPRSLFFPLISKLLFLCDEAGVAAPNLHVFAGNAAWLDELIVGEGLDETAVWLYPYAGTFLSEADQHLPRIWIPILGEGDPLALQRIFELVAPTETCPLLPFPSRNPRRGDILFESYHGVLFDRLRTDSGTVIYADEGNPFQVYRRLRESTLRYGKSLQELGGCKVAFSSLSSKLVSLGALLAAYELMGDPDHITGVAEVGTQTHRLLREVSIEEAREKTELAGLSLTGDCYR